MPPPHELIEALRRFRGVNAVSRRLTDLFVKAGLEECRYTPNGVDDELFKPVEPIGRNKEFITVGFSGSKKHDHEKGISSYIEPLGREYWIRLNLAMPQNGYVTLDEMPRFYNQTDLYLCASSAEGFSVSALEASACGRPLISTDVGGNRELIKDGHNGFFIKRDLGDIRDKLYRLHRDRGRLIEMGMNNRDEVEKKWSWKIRVADWIEFIKDTLNADRYSK